MAHVISSDREPAETRRERAQLLIVIGLVFAITLISLALFLNSIIYAENVGARGADVGGSDATAFVNTVESEGETLVRTANDEEEGHGNQTRAVEENLADWNNQSRLLYGSSGVYTNVEYDDSENGTQIVQGEVENRAFTSADGEANWTLAINVTARDFVMNVSDENLTATESDPFELCISEGGVIESEVLVDDCEGDLSEAESLFIYENGDGNINVTNNDDIACETEDGEDEALIDFSTGTLNGRECEEGDVDDVFDGFDSYDISYINGDLIEGNYSFVVDDPDFDDPGTTLGLENPSYNDPDDGSPYFVDAVWSAEVRVTYETPRLDYRSTIEIVPGEIDD